MSIPTPTRRRPPITRPTPRPRPTPTRYGYVLGGHAGHLVHSLITRRIDTQSLATRLLEAVRSGDDDEAGRVALRLAALDEEHPQAVSIRWLVQERSRAAGLRL